MSIGEMSTVEGAAVEFVHRANGHTFTPAGYCRSVFVALSISRIPSFRARCGLGFLDRAVGAARVDEARAMAKPDEGLRLAIAIAGNRTALAKLLGISHQAVSQWQRVPVHRILQVEQVTGVQCEQLSEPDEGLRLAIAAAGSRDTLAELLGMRRAAAVSGWRRVPAYCISQVEAVTGIPREQLRPDLYRRLGRRR
jgi:DNA-binding transcriptional regulator YdaS (Cro superfamily)